MKQFQDLAGKRVRIGDKISWIDKPSLKTKTGIVKAITASTLSKGSYYVEVIPDDLPCWIRTMNINGKIAQCRKI